MKIYNFLIPFLFFIVGFANVGKDLVGIKMDHYPGDLVDARFNNAILEHDYRWLRGWNAELWSPPFFSPAKNMLAGSDNHLGTFGIYSAFRVFGLNEFRSFQCWIIALLILNFAVCYYVLKQFGLDTTSASLGAFIFSFSMPVVGQFFHVQTLCKFPIPLLFLYCKKWLDSANIKHLFFLVISWVYLVFCSIYFGLLILPILFVFFLVSWFQKKSFFKNFDRQKIALSIGLTLVCLCLLIPIITHYSSMGNTSELANTTDVNKFLPSAISYLTPVYGNFWWSWLSLKLQTGYENAWLLNFFPGIFPLTMCIIIILNKGETSNETRFLLVNKRSFLFSILFFTAFFGFSFYSILTWLPGFEHLKVVGRFYLIAYFIFGLLVAYCWKIYFSKKSILFQTIALILILGEHINVSGTCSYIDYDNASKHHLKLVEQINKLKTKDHAVFVVLKPSTAWRNNQEWQVDAMMASLATGLPTLNGYSTATPPNFEWINQGSDSASIKQWLLMNNWDTVDVFKKVIICK